MKAMLCESVTPEQAKELCASGKWMIEQKVDGVRGMIVDGRLYDRRGKDITERFPEFKGIEKMQGVFDGELICKTGDFGDIQSRMHLRDKFLLRLAQEKTPAFFVMFDALSSAKDWTLLEERKKRLVAFKDSGMLPSWVMVLPFWASDVVGFDASWGKVQQEGWEGLVIKNPDSIYGQRRSKSWLKVKAFLETKAEFTMYEDHPRGITITTADGRRVVVNGAMAPKVKHAIIKNGKASCEIQYMKSALEGSDAWRFPSFRGLVDETDA